MFIVVVSHFDRHRPHSSIGVVVPFALLEMGSLMVVIMFTILLEGVKDGNAAFKGKVVPLADAHLDSVALSQESI